MLEARISKAVVVQKETGHTHLMGVAEYCDDKVNFTMPFDWETLDYEWFVGELREKLAEDFDLPVYRVDIQADKLLQLMKEQSAWLKSRVVH